MTTRIEVRLILEKETKGALHYQEVDDGGQAIEQAAAKIGTLYLRKPALERGAPFPQSLRVTVEADGEVTLNEKTTERSHAVA
jgi:hypothetical protein